MSLSSKDCTKAIVDYLVLNRDTLPRDPRKIQEWNHLGENPKEWKRVGKKTLPGGRILRAFEGSCIATLPDDMLVCVVEEVNGKITGIELGDRPTLIPKYKFDIKSSCGTSYRGYLNHCGWSFNVNGHSGRTRVILFKTGAERVNNVPVHPGNITDQLVGILPPGFQELGKGIFVTEYTINQAQNLLKDNGFVEEGCLF